MFVRTYQYYNNALRHDLLKKSVSGQVIDIHIENL